MRLFVSFATLFVTLAMHGIAREAPEKTLGTLLKKMSGHAMSVDAVIAGEKNVQVKGIIYRADSDLTVTTPEGKSVRTIISEGRAWISADGKPWESVAQIDRTFPRLLIAPVAYNGKTPPPFEEVDRKPEGPLVIQHIRLKVPKSDSDTDRPNYWLAWRGSQPLEIRRAEVPVVLSGHTILVKADYRLDRVPAIAPPADAPRASNPATVFTPETLLALAKKRMMAAPAWTVNATINGDEQFKLTGILEGQKCDLTIEAPGQPSTRYKVIGDLQFVSTDGGSTWKKGKAERDYFYLVNTPIQSRDDETIPPFEIVTAHPGDTSVLQIRFRASEPVSAEGDRPNYWIAIADGKPTSIRRYLGPLGFRGKYVTASVEYEPAPAVEVGKTRVTAPAE